MPSSPLGKQISSPGCANVLLQQEVSRTAACCLVQKIQSNCWPCSHFNPYPQLSFPYSSPIKSFLFLPFSKVIHFCNNTYFTVAAAGTVVSEYTQMFIFSPVIHVLKARLFNCPPSFNNGKGRLLLAVSASLLSKKVTCRTPCTPAFSVTAFW